MVAIVTGGAKGIGKAIVETLAKKGIKVVFSYFHSETLAEELQQELLKNGYEVEKCYADISKKEDVKKLVKFAKEKFGDINILINNAGISLWKMFLDITDEDWNNVIQTNLTSVFYMIQEVLQDMIHRKNGCIINISSIWGMVGASCETVYSVTKAGIDAITKSLAKELGPSNIRVNSIAPGYIITDMNKDLTQTEIESLKTEIPLGKLGKPEDIAKCVEWLIEDNYTTGQIISPNGGWVII